MPNRKPLLLFEVSWEVCNQVGGIYTVLRSKAPTMTNRWGEAYCLLGPYNHQSAPVEFEQAPFNNLLAGVCSDLTDSGLVALPGYWLIDGRPPVVLFDLAASAKALHALQEKIASFYGFSADLREVEVKNALLLGAALFKFFQTLSENGEGSRCIVHLHEWQTAAALPLLKNMLSLPILFTTHATVLGRFVAADRRDFYEVLPVIDPLATARHYGIEEKYLIERQAAVSADVFSTVSEVTSREAELLLGRKPDAILPNGLNIERFTVLHEFQNLHRIYKERIHDFVIAHFFPSYTFDLERTLYFFVSGRYEFHNKGMDVAIDAMHLLNQRLRGLVDPPTVVFFIITRAPTYSINVAVLQQQAMFAEVKNTCREVVRGIRRRLVASVVHKRLPSFEELLPYDLQARLRRAMYAWHNDRLPLIVTHVMVNDADDPVLTHVRERRLFNAASDPVKVVYHPDFLTSTSPLLALDYDHFVRGCHLGIFPSYYEPWGYTPLECLALGVPTVTSDLAGFGCFSKERLGDQQYNGLVVLERERQTPAAAAQTLSEYLFAFAQLNRRERVELRYRAERLSSNFDWPKLIEYYDRAYEAVLEAANKSE